MRVVSVLLLVALMASAAFAMTMGQQQAWKIIQYEGRFDKQGHLMVYILPSGDGGGKYEVAGINDRYHPEAAKALKSLIENKKFEEAKNYAAEYLRKYTDSTAAKSDIPAIQFYLRDSAFNRGPGGAVKILQHALGLKVDGGFGSATQAALEKAEQDDAPKLLKALRASREWYERVYAKRGPGNKFWNGLVNRWNNSYNDAVKFGFEENDE